MLVVLIDGPGSENGVFPDEGVSVFLSSEGQLDELRSSCRDSTHTHEAASDGRDERLEKLGLPDLLQESQGCSSDVFVRMLLQTCST
jgi:hypothetical protein